MWLVEVKAYGSSPNTFTDKMKINTEVKAGIQGATLGLACWNSIFRVSRLKAWIKAPLRVGSQFVPLVKESHPRLRTKAIRVMGTRATRSGENWPNMFFSFRFILLRGVRWFGL